MLFWSILLLAAAIICARILGAEIFRGPPGTRLKIGRPGTHHPISLQCSCPCQCEAWQTAINQSTYTVNHPNYSFCCH